MKMFDREKAIEAMYELNKQGFQDVTLWLSGNYLILGCKGDSKAPDIAIDSVQDWSNDTTDYGSAKDVVFWSGARRFDFWWIFD